MPDKGFQGIDHWHEMPNKISTWIITMKKKKKKRKRKNLRYVTRVKLLFFFFERESDTLRLTGIAKRVLLRVIETTPGRLGTGGSRDGSGATAA